MAISEAIIKSASRLRAHAPTIHTVLGAVGVVATVALAIKATPKAMTIIKHDLGYDPQTNIGDKPSAADVVKATWKCYIPTLAVGGATIYCIFAANALNKDQQAALTSAYILLNNTYKEYQNRVTELFGEDADEKVQQAIVQSKYDSTAMTSNTCDEVLLFYEEHHGEFFQRTLAQVIDAEYQFNKKYVLDGDANVSDFLELLGLPRTMAGNALGWSTNYICDFCTRPWIDFEHELVELDDGMECYIIHYKIEPTVDYLDY